jgi:carbon storage regulator
MLVLGRKSGEQIVIADEIVVTVIEVAQGRVRLGIEAPPEVQIMRQELLTDNEPLPPRLVPLKG